MIGLGQITEEDIKYAKTVASYPVLHICALARLKFGCRVSVLNKRIDFILRKAAIKRDERLTPREQLRAVFLDGTLEHKADCNSPRTPV